ncbi:MAG: C10 family peptidase [Muribaculaceae bacterium]|nr:C10 family peptidase [Muribaculaceae bacterium]
MRRLLLNALLLCAVCFQASAYVITVEQAQTTAQSFFNRLDPGGGFPDVVLSKTVYSNNDDSQAVYYIYRNRNMTNPKFVIVSAENSIVDILAFGNGILNLDDIPDGFRYLLDLYSEQIEYLLTQNPSGGNGNGYVRSASATQDIAIEPLLTTRWGQGKPFNAQCVFKNKVTLADSLCYAGCGATAMAQVMRYWSYPEVSPSLPGHYPECEKYDIPDLPETVFAWDDMNDSYDTSDQAEAVATLMRYAGQAQKMNYGVHSSGSGLRRIVNGLHLLGYDASWIVLNENNKAQWDSLMQNEFDANPPRPIIYSALSEDSGAGHIFNVDGYQEVDGTVYYHVNFGWPGIAAGNDVFCCLGEFAINENAPHYNVSQQMIVGIDPTPRIDVEPSSLSFSGNVGIPTSKTITVKGNDAFRFLGKEVSISSNGDNAEEFTVEPSILSANDIATENGATFNVTYLPTHAGGSTATLILASDALDEQLAVSLTGTATNPNPKVTVDSTQLTFEEFIDYTQERSFVVKGRQLKENLELSISGNASSLYSVSPSVITPAQAESGVMVTVAYSPTWDGTSHHDNAVIHITGESNIDKTVQLYGTSIISETILDISETDLSFNDGHTGYAQTQSFFVTGRIYYSFFDDENETVYETPLRDNVELHLEQVDNSRPFTISPTTITPKQAFKGIMVTVTYLPQEQGESSADIFLTSPHVFEQCVVGLNGKANAEPCFRANTHTLSFDDWHTDYAATQTLMVSAYHINGDVELNLDSPSGQFGISHTSIPDDSAGLGVPVTITYLPVADGLDSATLTVSAPNAESIVINITGNASSVPHIDVDSTALYFEEYTGYTQTKTFNVRGYHINDDVTLSMNANQCFSISPSTISNTDIERGAVVFVNYTPRLKSIGDDYGTISLNSSDSCMATVDLAGQTFISTFTLSTDVEELTFEESVTDTLSFDIICKLIFSFDGHGGDVYSLHTTTDDAGDEQSSKRFGSLYHEELTPVYHFLFSNSYALEVDGENADDFVVNDTVTSYYNPFIYYPATYYPTVLPSRIGSSTSTGATVVFNPQHEGPSVRNAVLHIVPCGFSAKPLTLPLTGHVETQANDILRGDASGDGVVTIADVTALIDYLLSGNATGISLENADVNGDGEVSIADVTILIDYLLTGTWP